MDPEKRAIAAVFLALLGIALIAAAAEKAPQEPFYRRYLVPGNPLDEKIGQQEKRVAASPDSADLRNDFGNLLAARRFPREAKEQYETAMRLDRAFFLAPYNLGLLYESEGKISRAISAYEKSVDRNRGFPPSRFRLGRLYEKKGWTGKAIEQYARALQIDPAMRDPRHNPLVVDTRLMNRVSLENYGKDLATASMRSEAAYAEEARFRRITVPVDRPLASEDLVDSSAPEPADTARPAQGLRSPASLPPRPGETRPQGLAPPPGVGGPILPVPPSAATPPDPRPTATPLP